MMISKLNTICVAAVLAFTAVPAAAQEALPVTVSEDADPTVSIALTWVFGKGAAVGVKAFSTNREGDAAVTLGLDYLFNTGAWRPNAGVAYIDNDAFLDLSVGFWRGDIDFGVGLGPIDGKVEAHNPGPGGPGSD